MDQTWQDVWLHNRDILSASCMCIDNTAVTFQKYIGFGLSGLENPTQQNKKRADHTHALFSFFNGLIFFLYVSALYVVISIQIANEKKAISDVHSSLDGSSHVLIPRKEMITQFMNL